MRGYIDSGQSRLGPKAGRRNGDYPEAPVCLDLYAGGRLIAQVLANRYREDLKRAGIGSGHHSFRFAVPDGVALAPNSVRRATFARWQGFATVGAGETSSQIDRDLT